jgi:hypothetical protein
MAEVTPRNRARSTLTAAITSSVQTGITFRTLDISKFNTTGTYRVILWNDAVLGPWEICTVTGGQSTQNLVVDRASETVFGTQVAQANWPVGTNIAAILTEGSINALLAFHGASAYLTTNVPLTDGQLTLISPNNEEYDTDLIHDTMANSSRFVAPSGMTGYWRVEGYVEFDANAAGSRYAELHKNGVLYRSLFSIPSAGAARHTVAGFGLMLYLTAGQYIEFLVAQYSGGPLDLWCGSGGSVFQMTYLGNT